MAKACGGGGFLMGLMVGNLRSSLMLKGFVYGFLWFTVHVKNVDTVFYPPLICVPDPKKPKKIIFSPWGHENIYNGMAQPVQTLECSKCLFQPK